MVYAFTALNNLIKTENENENVNIWKDQIASGQTLPDIGEQQGEMFITITVTVHQGMNKI